MTHDGIDNTGARRSRNKKNAFQFAQVGLYVFPSDGKVPLIPRYNRADTSLTKADVEAAVEEFMEKHEVEPAHVGATRDPEVIKRMWRKFPDAVPSISCGPSRLVVLDADLKDNGPAKMAELFAEIGGVPEGVPVNPTKSGGRHFVFADPEGKFTNKAGLLKKQYGTDVRGAGGQFVGPGSIREDGKTYGSDADRLNFLRAITSGKIPQLPEKIVELIGTRPEGANNEVSEKDSGGLVRHLRETDWPVFEDIFAPAELDGLYDLDALRRDNESFGPQYDAPSGTDKSTDRMKIAYMLLKQWPDMPVEHLAVFYEHWDGAGSQTDDGKGAGNYSLRDIAREWQKNSNLVREQGTSKPSDGSAFEAVDDDEDGGSADRPKSAEKTKRSEFARYEAALKAMAAAPKDTGKPASGLRSALDHIREFTPQDELVEGLWPIKGLCSVYGDSNSGKTFFTFAAGKAVAKGATFNGGDTQKAGVLYFGSEGREGTDGRMSALYMPMTDAEAKATGLDPEEFATPDESETIHTSFDFPFDVKTSREACARFYRVACDFKELRGEFPGLIVVDHLVAMLPAGGNLNDPVEMNTACKELRKLQEVLGCLIVVIGHTNKSEGYLGSVMQRAAWDRSLKIEKQGQGEGAVHKLHADKVRDGLAGGSSNTFRLVTRKIGKTPRGKEVTSAVVSFDASFAFPEVDDNEERVLSGAAACETLEDFIVQHMRRETEGSERPPVFTSVELREAITPALDHFAPKGRTKVKDASRLGEQRRKQFGRAVAALEKSGRLNVEPTNGVQSILRLPEPGGKAR